MPSVILTGVSWIVLPPTAYETRLLRGSCACPQRTTRLLSSARTAISQLDPPDKHVDPLIPSQAFESLAHLIFPLSLVQPHALLSPLDVHHRLVVPRRPARTRGEPAAFERDVADPIALVSRAWGEEADVGGALWRGQRVARRRGRGEWWVGEQLGEGGEEGLLEGGKRARELGR